MTTPPVSHDMFEWREHRSVTLGIWDINHHIRNVLTSPCESLIVLHLLEINLANQDIPSMTRVLSPQLMLISMAFNGVTEVGVTGIL